MKYFIALRSKLINNFKPGNVKCLHGYEIYVNGPSSYNSIKNLYESLRISDRKRELERESVNVLCESE